MTDNLFLTDSVVLGVIVSAHGLKGQFKVKSFTEPPENLFAYGNVKLESGEELSLRLVSKHRELLICAAQEIEEVILTHPGVLEAAAVSVAHSRLGEGVAIFVTVKKGSNMSLEILTELCLESQLAKQKWPQWLWRPRARGCAARRGPTRMCARGAAGAWRRRPAQPMGRDAEWR